MKGRLHLPDITDKYKKKIVLSIDDDDLNAQKIKMDETEIVYSNLIRISSNLIRTSFTESRQNDVAAIAAVDYAIKERKPTCGFAMEFEMAFKV